MEWISVDERLPSVFAGKFNVETSNGMIFPCYFYSDRMSWIAFYKQKPSYWWNAKTLEPEFNVIKWMENKIG